MPDLKVAAGFPEMWQPVYEKYKHFFECAYKLQPIVSEAINAPVQGVMLQVIGRLMAAAANSYGALLTLVLNGYGHDAMKIARSIFEIEINILRLRAHPDELDDFIDYTHIQDKLYYDTFSDEQKKQVPKERLDQMMQDYDRVLPRFVGRDKKTPRKEWCRESLYSRAKEAGPDYLELYRTFYRFASSLHHMDVGGIIAHTDGSMMADIAPSWEHLDDALVASACVIRCIELYDDMAALGLKDRIQQGPNQAYVAALKAL